MAPNTNKSSSPQTERRTVEPGGRMARIVVEWEAWDWPPASDHSPFISRIQAQAMQESGLLCLLPR